MERENRVCVFYGTKKREGKDSRYIQEASAPAAVTMYQICNIMYNGNSRYYYMICQEVTCTEIAELTHRLRTHSRRLIHESSLATATAAGNCNHELPWTSMVFQALMYIKTELLLR